MQNLILPGEAGLDCFPSSGQGDQELAKVMIPTEFSYHESPTGEVKFLYDLTQNGTITLPRNYERLGQEIENFWETVESVKTNSHIKIDSLIELGISSYKKLAIIEELVKDPKNKRGVMKATETREESKIKTSFGLRFGTMDGSPIITGLIYTEIIPDAIKSRLGQQTLIDGKMITKGKIQEFKPIAKSNLRNGLISLNLQGREPSSIHLSDNSSTISSSLSNYVGNYESESEKSERNPTVFLTHASLNLQKNDPTQKRTSAPLLPDFSEEGEEGEEEVVDTGKDGFKNPFLLSRRVTQSTNEMSQLQDDPEEDFSGEQASEIRFHDRTNSQAQISENLD